MDGENQIKKGRVFPKIFKLDENNQYGFAMKNPLPIGTFKKEPQASMEILNKSLENFDPNAEVGEIFLLDIGFAGYNDPKKNMYNEVFPCIFEPKSKVPVESRSVCQLLSTMRIGKTGDVLKFKATEKMHATLCSKKRFPMFIDHIHFLTRRVSWKVNYIHYYYTFEQEPL